LVLIGIIIAIVLTPAFQYKILRQSIRLLKFRIHLTGKRHWRMWWLPICSLLGVVGFVAAQLLGRYFITSVHSGFSTVCAAPTTPPPVSPVTVWLQLDLPSELWLVMISSLMLVWACTNRAVESVWTMLIWPHDIFFLTDLIDDPQAQRLLRELATLQNFPVDQFTTLLTEYLDRDQAYTTAVAEARARWYSPSALRTWLLFFRRAHLLAATPSDQIEGCLELAVQRGFIQPWESVTPPSSVLA
jgi:hypothetical protein